VGGRYETSCTIRKEHRRNAKCGGERGRSHTDKGYKPYTPLKDRTMKCQKKTNSVLWGDGVERQNQLIELKGVAGTLKYPIVPEE